MSGSANVVVSHPLLVITVCVAKRDCLIVCMFASSQTPASAAFLFFKLTVLGAIGAIGVKGRRGWLRR